MRLADWLMALNSRRPLSRSAKRQARQNRQHATTSSLVEHLEARTMLSGTAAVDSVETGSITGVKFEDINGNGTLDAGEPGQAGWTVYVDLNRNAEFDAGEPSAVTGSDGAYQIDNVPQGMHDLRAVQQPGWHHSFAGLNENPNGNLIEFASLRDMVYDPMRSVLYAITEGGTIERFDPLKQTFLSPWQVGTDLKQFDTTPDGRYLYAVEGTLVDGQGLIRKIDLETGSVTDITFTPESSELGVADIAIANDGTALVATRAAGSNRTYLRRLDLETEEFSIIDPTLILNGELQLERGVNRSVISVLEKYYSSQYLRTFDVAANSLSERDYASGGDPVVAVSHDGQFTATRYYSSTRIYMDQQYTGNIHKQAGGFTFSAVENQLYIGDLATNEIVVIDAQTRTEIDRFDARGEFLPADSVAGSGMLASPDGRWLFVQTVGGVRSFPVGQFAVSIPVEDGETTDNANLGSLPTVRPTLQFPVNVISVNRRPEFQWEAAPEAVYYELWVNDLTTGQNRVVYADRVRESEYPPSVDLTDKHDYIWTVRAVYVDGTTSEWAEHQSFGIERSQTPVTIGPEGLVTAPRPTFEWEAIAGATGYRLEIDNLTTGQFRFIEDELPGDTVSYTLPYSLPLGSYRWKVTVYGGLTRSSVDKFFQVGRQYAPITVNTTDDLGDATYLGDGQIDVDPMVPGEQISLRAAIQETNHRYGHDTILLPSGTFTFSVAGTDEDEAYTGDLDIIKTAGNLTIVGAGVGQTIIDAAQLDRVFEAHSGTNLTLRNLTVTGGSNGGIYVDTHASLRLESCEVRANVTSLYGDGGGLEGSFDSSIEIFDSSIVQNTASFGGGLYSRGSIRIIDSLLANNKARSYGGAVYSITFSSDSNVFEIRGTTISGNTAQQGAALYVYRSRNAGSTAKIINSTITRNFPNYSSAVYASSDVIQIQNTIIAGNQTNLDLDAGFVSGGHNFFGIVASSGLPALTDTDEINVDLTSILDPILRDNGGPTWTHALLPGSRAIDAGDNQGVADTDQRGSVRIADGNGDGQLTVDIGAYEYQPAPQAIDPDTTIFALRPTFHWTATAGNVTYELQIDDITAGTTSVIHETGILSNAYTPAVRLPADHEFRWKVRAVHQGGVTTDWSNELSFATVSAIPLVTGLPAVTTDTQPRLEWSSIPGAVRYDVWMVDATLGNQTVARDPAMTTTEYVLPAELKRGHLYIWTVRAVNSDGSYSEWADHQRFEVTLIRPVIKTSPAFTLDITPTLQWSAVEQAATYDVWVNDLTTGEVGVIRDRHVTGTTYTPSEALTVGHRYVWAVRGIPADGAGSRWSDYSFFEIELASPVVADVPTSTTETQPTLHWSAVEHATHYELWVNDLTTGEVGVIRDPNVTTNAYTPDMPLEAGHDYVWTVRAMTKQGAIGDWADYQYLSIKVGTPVIKGPLGTTDDRTPTLQWSAVEGAVRYDVWVNDLTSGRTGVVRNRNVTSNELTLNVPLAIGNRYIWSVQAISETGSVSEWAELQTFEIPLVAPTLSSPVTTADTTRPTFRWSPVAGAVRYELWVNDVTTGEVGVIHIDHAMGFFYTATSSLQPGHDYQWTMRAINRDGVRSDWAAHQVFRVDAPMPSAASGIVLKTSEEQESEVVSEVGSDELSELVLADAVLADTVLADWHATDWWTDGAVS